MFFSISLLLILILPSAAATKFSGNHSELSIENGSTNSPVILTATYSQKPPEDERFRLSMLFWNLENFFDYKDEGKGEADKEFSSFGSRHWSKKKFYRKCRAVAKSILWIGEQSGRLPDLIGLAEIENRFVLKKLINETVLRKLDYEIVHYDSPDPRGIDVALLYRKASLFLIESKPCSVKEANEDTGKAPRLLRTRDILLARFQMLNPEADLPESLSVLVNHHPSKFGGGASEWKRAAALERLRGLKDSLYFSGERLIIAAGDFNDTPENPLFKKLTENRDSWDGLINMAEKLAEAKEGTIKFDGKWELIDMFFVSKYLENSEMTILALPFLLAKDKAHAGTKPLRTFAGPRYIGGVSDHFPILLHIRKAK